MISQATSLTVAISVFVIAVAIGIHNYFKQRAEDSERVDKCDKNR